MVVWRLLAAVLLVLLPSVARAAPATNGFTTEMTAQGPVITFTDGDYVLDASQREPERGWQRLPSPDILRDAEAYWHFDRMRVLWGRHRFDRAALGADPLAILTTGNRNQFRVFLNGRELFRNYASPADRKQGWYRPYLITVPQGALRPGINEIAVRAESNEAVGVGKLTIGPNAPLQAFYAKVYFWRISGPGFSSTAMLLLGGLSFVAWLARRRETELLYLSLLTVLCYLRYQRFFGEDVLIDGGFYSAVSFYSTYFAGASTTAFYLAYLQVPQHRRIIFGVFAAGVPLVLVHTLFRTSDSVIYAGASLVTLGMLVFGVTDFLRERSLERRVVSTTMVFMPVLALYDLQMFNAARAWNSNDAYLSPFGGFGYTLAFLVSFGMRAMKAFTGLSAANQTLEQRVAEARRELADSEAQRQHLMVGRAVATERERLMQEMHDGIGSNLITALAVAEQQHQPAATIKTLRRAIGDLKITVDSLEPVEGDVVALIGNLRHRMAKDLAEAGITCRWQVDPCGNLPWLDAANALHVLRIFQETIGNVLQHSGATEMRIGCREESRAGQGGIAAFVADNGAGFAGVGTSSGKGLSNIHARARALRGELACETAPGAGTTITLWLPYDRAALKA